MVVVTKTHFALSGMRAIRLGQLERNHRTRSYGFDSSDFVQPDLTGIRPHKLVVNGLQQLQDDPKGEGTMPEVIADSGAPCGLVEPV